MTCTVLILRAERAINNEYIVGRIYYNMDRSRRLENHLIGEPAQPDATLSFLNANKCVIPLSICSKAITKQTSVTDATVRFFIDNHYAGMALDQRSASWNNPALDEKEKIKLRNLYNSIKCAAARMTLMQADSFPPTPDNSLRKCLLRKIASVVEERIQADFDLASGK